MENLLKSTRSFSKKTGNKNKSLENIGKSNTSDLQGGRLIQLKIESILFMMEEIRGKKASQMVILGNPDLKEQNYMSDYELIDDYRIANDIGSGQNSERNAEGLLENKHIEYILSKMVAENLLYRYEDATNQIIYKLTQKGHMINKFGGYVKHLQKQRQYHSKLVYGERISLAVLFSTILQGLAIIGLIAYILIDKL